MTLTNNAQFLYEINKNSILGISNLTSVIYNGITATTATVSNSSLSSFLYSQNVIDFAGFATSNVVTFNFNPLPIHKKLIVRARLYTTCAATYDTHVIMTLSGATNVNQTLTTITSLTTQV